MIRSAAADRAPLRGTLRVIVVLVDFSDKHMTQTKQHYKDLFFSTGVIPTKSVREYYQDVTNGLIDIDGDVVGPFRLPQTIATYAHGASGIGNATPNAQTLARDAVIASDPSVNFAPYDDDGNGLVDAFIVIHAGSGAEQTGSPSDIWSHKWTLDGGARSVDGTKIFGYLTVPEDCEYRRMRARTRAPAVRFPRPVRYRRKLRRHRQLVPDGGRKLGRWRQYARPSFRLVQSQPGLGIGR